MTNPSAPAAMPVRAGRDLPVRSLIFDVALGVGLAIITSPLLWLNPFMTVHRPYRTTAIMLVIAAALTIRRRFPLSSAALAYAAGLIQLVAGIWLIFPGDALLLVSLYSVMAFGPVWAGNAALGATLLGSSITVLGFANEPTYSGSTGLPVLAFALAACAFAAWALGRARRSHELSRVFSRRAEELTDLDRERVAQLATAAERARIAREMHDIVAHSLSIVIAQADGGRYSGTKDPAAALTALETISQTGRAALADMRRLLGVLRPEDDAAQMAPQPDEQSIEALVAGVRAAGLQVSLVTLGVARTLPPGMGLALYRICQEALTNAMKHAGPGAQVTVVSHWLPSQVTLTVEDDGRGAAAESDHAGHGLVGMRQRAEMFGGTVTAGPRPGGGFQVRAILPTPVAAPVSPPPATPPPAPPSATATPTGPPSPAPAAKESPR